MSTAGRLVASVAVPKPGQLIPVDEHHWVVGDASMANPSARAEGADRKCLVPLHSVEGDRYDESVQMLWSLELGAWVFAPAAMAAL